MPDDRPLSEVAYDSLKSMILSGRVKPGERLGERELARRINVSRTPLRARRWARLARDGLAINLAGARLFRLRVRRAADRGALRVPRQPRGHGAPRAAATRDQRGRGSPEPQGIAARPRGLRAQEEAERRRVARGGQSRLPHPRGGRARMRQSPDLRSPVPVLYDRLRLLSPGSISSGSTNGRRRGGEHKAISPRGDSSRATREGPLRPPTAM